MKDTHKFNHLNTKCDEKTTYILFLFPELQVLKVTILIRLK